VWLSEGRANGLSPKTLSDRRRVLGQLVWWLENEAEETPEFAALTPAVVRLYLAYCREANPRGRWGSERGEARREARPGTVREYFRTLRSFLLFCREEGLLPPGVEPLRNVRPPKVPVDQIEPFSEEQVQRLIDGARQSRNPERDVAILFVLVDSGIRVGELCGLCVEDAERGTGELRVVGKGNKERTALLATRARRVLSRYVEFERAGAGSGEPLFVGVGGKTPGGPLTPRGVRQILAAAGRAAGIEGVRCSPHTLRHTFAVNYLRGGGNVFELQQLMGHSDLETLSRYVKLAQVDLAQGHRKASPADRMRLR
jgi:site-specific recombinase XerD